MGGWMDGYLDRQIYGQIDQNRLEKDYIDWIRLDEFGLDQMRLDQIGLDWIGSDQIRQMDGWIDR